MLDDYKIEQNIIYKTITNCVSSNRISHAYIIESNGYSKAYNLALSFAKYILCPKCYTTKEKCNDCNQCNNIDNNDFLELKIINPDGMWIKKNEMDELQELFSKKSIFGNKKVYIINHAEKLNDSSANSILKFLEEPEEGITAILIVENINMLLSTIVSRCQILSLKPNRDKENLSTIEKIARHLKNSEEEINIYIENEIKDNNINHVINFVKSYEHNKALTLININKLWNEYFKDRNQIYDSFMIMLLFYKDVLNNIINRGIEYFDDYIEDVKTVSKNNNKENIIVKINVIMDLLEKIKYNINNNLLMDKLIIELEGCEKK